MPGRPETWSERHDAIRAILRREAIHDQRELLERLRRRGFAVTQPSVSRDLRELHVAKVDGRYVVAEALAAGATVADELGEAATAIRRVRRAGDHLLVVHTPPGRAPVVALALDQAGWVEVVGTIAGDDTLFVATAGARQQARVAARLRALVKEPGHG